MRFLGGFEVSVGTRTIEKKRYRLKNAVSLVKLLALAPGHRMHREQVMDTLWPDSGKKAASNNLRQVLYAAREALDPASDCCDRYLRVEHEQIALCPHGRLWVDVEAFEEAAAAARRSRDPAAYWAALDLYAGDLLPEDLYEGWAEGRREGLRQLYLALLLEAAELCEERKEYGLAIEALRAATAMDPALEEAHASLMRLHALSGRPERVPSRYEHLHNALSRGLGAQPNPTPRRLRDEGAAGKFDSPPSAALWRRGNLPDPRTSFVGRESEMAGVKGALSRTRLLTLTGTGGCGKTRLALEACKELVCAYPDGVWFVQLAPLSDGTLVTQTLAATLGIREQPGRPLLEILLGALRDREMLLVLDNCEHLIDAASQLAHALLCSCPRLRVLATSREPLGVMGEVIRSVPPLSVLGAQRYPTVEELEGYESARLLADRASERNPGFELTSENAPAVAQVCARLEGIPLAIELAAARIGVLSVEQVSDRVGRALELLTSEDPAMERRHRTLRAALDWSHELLSEPGQALFRRLSVFAGGFTLEAAESVGAGGGIGQGEVLDLLSMLVDRSLVVAEESRESGARYRLLEPVRQYAREKLEASEEEAETRHRHARWYLALAEEADNASSGTDHARWLQRLETEHDNLRAALGWSLGEEGDAELGLRLAGALWLFWFTRGYLFEGRGWLEKAISLGGPPAARARALNGAGWMVMFQGDFTTAKTVLEESLILYRELNDEEGIASSLSFLGHVALLGHRDDIPVAALLEEALTLKPRLENRRTIANMLVTAGIAAGLLRGDLGDAAALFEEARALYREMGDTWGVIACLVNLGLISVILEHHARAKALLRDVMQLSRELNEKVGSVYSFFGLGCVAASEGLTTRAARLWGVSEAVREATGIEIMPSTYSVTGYEGRLAEARSRLGEAAFQTVWGEGRAMAPQEAMEYALSNDEPLLAATRSPGVTSTEGQSHGLTCREEEVALLVARGLTDRQISSELGISERTAGNHVSSILRKLGLRSRTQIAIGAAGRQPPAPDRD